MATSKHRNYDEEALLAITEAERLIEMSRQTINPDRDIFTLRAQVFATIAVAYSNIGDQS